MKSLLTKLTAVYFTAACCTPLVVGADGTIAHDYCVVGAGPAGLQIGYFLQSSNRDYVIFEKSPTAGSFFEHYPRHRKIISINKRFTGRTNKEFNLRHDWNSLISDDDSLLLTKYSKDYFPHADVLVQYLHDYQQRLNLSVQFNTEVSRIQQNNDANCRFSMKDQKGQQYCCRKSLIIANGISVPRVTTGVGHEMVEGYETMSIDPEEFENQNVIIFGRGNSGMETAISLYGHVAHLTLASRGRMAFSWDTHYVGDLRAVNNEVLDAYQLKSLDGLIEMLPLEETEFHTRPDGKIDLYPTANAPLNLMPMDNNPCRQGFDRVIRCTGFKWDRSLFSKNTTPHYSKVSDRFPEVDYNYESAQFPGMYFAGALGHSLDYRKSAGGFIHGFRYTARATHRLMEWANHGLPWPSISKPIHQLASTLLNRANEGSGIYQMFTHFGDIAIYNRSSKTFTYLEEVPMHLWTRMGTKLGHIFEPKHQLLFTMTLEYGKNFSQVGADHFQLDRAVPFVELAYTANFLHPVIRVFDTIPSFNQSTASMTTVQEEMPVGIHHVLEDFTTQFTSTLVHVGQLRKFIEFHTELDLQNYPPVECLADYLTTVPYCDHCMRMHNSEESVALY